jgi:transposase
MAEENRKLRAENERLGQERDLLRRAAKFVAGETNW